MKLINQKKSQDQDQSRPSVQAQEVQDSCRYIPQRASSGSARPSDIATTAYNVSEYTSVGQSTVQEESAGLHLKLHSNHIGAYSECIMSRRQLSSTPSHTVLQPLSDRHSPIKVEPNLNTFETACGDGRLKMTADSNCHLFSENACQPDRWSRVAFGRNRQRKS